MLRNSNVNANKKITFGHDYKILFNFSNKTDTDLTIGCAVELETDATKSTSYNDESLLSISSGFSKIVLDSNNVFFATITELKLKMLKKLCSYLWLRSLDSKIDYS